MGLHASKKWVEKELAGKQAKLTGKQLENIAKALTDPLAFDSAGSAAAEEARAKGEEQKIREAVAGKADLVEGVVPASQLPSYVDDVLEYGGIALFPQVGERGKIYVDTVTNRSYRWGGSTYVEISKSLALGETAETAGRGDLTKTAYAHSQKGGNPHGTKFSELEDKPEIPDVVEPFVDEDAKKAASAKSARNITDDIVYSRLVYDYTPWRMVISSGDTGAKIVDYEDFDDERGIGFTCRIQFSDGSFADGTITIFYDRDLDESGTVCPKNEVDAENEDFTKEVFFHFERDAIVDYVPVIGPDGKPVRLVRSDGLGGYAKVTDLAGKLGNANGTITTSLEEHGDGGTVLTINGSADATPNRLNVSGGATYGGVVFVGARDNESGKGVLISGGEPWNDEPASIKKDGKEVATEDQIPTNEEITQLAADACKVNPSTALALKDRDCCLVAYTEGMTFTFAAKEEGQTGLRSFEVIITGCVKDGAVNWPAVTYRGDSTDLIPDDGDNHWTFAEQQDGSFAVTRHIANTFTIGE